MFKYYVVYDDKEIIKSTSDTNSISQYKKLGKYKVKEFDNPYDALMWRKEFRCAKNVNGEGFADSKETHVNTTSKT